MAAPNAGFNPAAIGLAISGNDMARRARAYWGPGAQEGDPVNIVKAQQAAQQRYLEVLDADPRAPVVLPLVDLVDPAWVRKAIYDDSYGVRGFAADVRKAQEAFVSEIDSVRKATTSASNLMHSISDDEVVMLFKKIYPASALIPVEVSIGKITQWDAIGPNEAGTAYFGSENPNLTDSEIQDHTRTAENKILYSVGGVTKMAYEAGKNQVPVRDMMAIRSLAANEMVRNLRERAILGVTRDVTSSSNVFTNATPLEYAGLHQLITANTGDDKTYVDVSGVDGGVKTMKEIDPYLDQVYENMISFSLTPNLALCSYKVFNIYRRELNEFFHTENVRELDYGIAKINLVFPGGEVPMVPCSFLPRATGANGAIKLLDTTKLARRVLWGETMEELANVNTVRRFVITGAEVLVDKTDVDATSSLQGGVFGITI